MRTLLLLLCTLCALNAQMLIDPYRFVVAAAGGGGQVEYVSSGVFGQAASGNVTLNMPSGLTSGDVLIAIIQNTTDSAVEATADWTSIYQGAVGTDSRLCLWYHRYAGSDPGLVFTNAGANTIVGAIAAFAGCVASGSPVGVLGTADGGNAEQVHDILGLTGVASGSVAVACHGDRDNNTFVGISGWTNVIAAVSTFGSPDGSATMYFKNASGTVADVQDSTTSAAPYDNWTSVMFSLTP